MNQNGLLSQLVPCQPMGESMMLKFSCERSRVHNFQLHSDAKMHARQLEGEGHQPQNMINSNPCYRTPVTMCNTTIECDRNMEKKCLDFYRLFCKQASGIHDPETIFPKYRKPRKSKNSRYLKPGSIPEYLLKGYMDGSKNAISSVYEFAQLHKVSVAFEEIKVLSSATFLYQCVLDGKRYLQAVGQTRKEAKNKAAVVAFDELMAADNIQGCAPVVTMEPRDVCNKIQPVRNTIPCDPGNMHPVNVLKKYCSKKKLKLDILLYMQETDTRFYCDVQVDDQLITTSCAKSKKEARRKAAEEVVKTLFSKGLPSNFDIMQQLARAKMNELLRNIPGIREYGSFAAFIIKRSALHQGEVIAIGTGERCLAGTNVTESGRTVLDCHAEVVARRALLKWIYSELNRVISGMMSESVFELNGDKLKLKDSVSLHLYLSTAPCGDASAFPAEMPTRMSEEEEKLVIQDNHFPIFDNRLHGQLRVKCAGDSTGSPVGNPVDKISLAELKSGQKQLRTMTCSDKLLKWKVLGVQGSLLTNFIEPIYITSMAVGNRCNLGHVARAVCCRMLGKVKGGGGGGGESQKGVEIHYPVVGRATEYDLVEVVRPHVPGLSLNWCAEDRFVEVLDSSTGISVPESPFRTGMLGASRLSKAGFLYRFKMFANKARQHYLLDSHTYREMKQQAEDYNRTKEMLYRELEAAGFGKWQRAPPELEMFS